MKEQSADARTCPAYAADRVAERFGATANIQQRYDHPGPLISRRPTSVPPATPTTELKRFGWEVQDRPRQVQTPGTVTEVFDNHPTGLPLLCLPT